MAIHSHEIAQEEEKKTGSSDLDTNNHQCSNETQEQTVKETQIPISDKSNRELVTNTNNNQNTEARTNVRHRKHKSSHKHHEKRKKRNISKDGVGDGHEEMKLKEKREQIETLKRILSASDEEIHKSESAPEHTEQTQRIALATNS
jgi:hypothetical protein